MPQITTTLPAITMAETTTVVAATTTATTERVEVIATWWTYCRSRGEVLIGAYLWVRSGLYRGCKSRGTSQHRRDRVVGNLSGDAHALLFPRFSRKKYRSQYTKTRNVKQEIQFPMSKGLIGSRPSDHYFRSVCLSVCLFVCLCRVFLSRLWSDFDQTRTYVICLGLVVSPRI